MTTTSSPGSLFVRIFRWLLLLQWGIGSVFVYFHRFLPHYLENKTLHFSHETRPLTGISSDVVGVYNYGCSSISKRWGKRTNDCFSPPSCFVFIIYIHLHKGGGQIKPPTSSSNVLNLYFQALGGKLSIKGFSMIRFFFSKSALYRTNSR